MTENTNYKSIDSAEESNPFARIDKFKNIKKTSSDHSQRTTNILKYLFIISIILLLISIIWTNSVTLSMISLIGLYIISFLVSVHRYTLRQNTLEKNAVEHILLLERMHDRGEISDAKYEEKHKTLVADYKMLEDYNFWRWH